MRESIKQNIERKVPKINDVKIYNGFPLFSFVELNVNELCNRTCVFCPRVNEKDYPNILESLDMGAFKNLVKDLLENSDEGKFSIISHGVGKYGRVLGELFVKGHDNSVNEMLKIEGHAYEYHGEKKKVFGS